MKIGLEHLDRENSAGGMLDWHWGITYEPSPESKIIVDIGDDGSLDREAISMHLRRLADVIEAGHVIEVQNV